MQGVVGLQPLRMGHEGNVRIEFVDALGGAVDLQPIDVRRGMDDLALQVRQRHGVVIDRAEPADARGGEIHQHRRAEPAGADHQHRGGLQLGLSRAADVAQHDMAGVAFELDRAQHEMTSLVDASLRR